MVVSLEPVATREPQGEAVTHMTVSRWWVNTCKGCFVRGLFIIAVLLRGLFLIAVLEIFLKDSEKSINQFKTTI